MKIAFIGTHGVGKTTLCYDLAAALKRRDLTVELVREVARECPLPINRDTTVKAQAWILHTQIAWELQAEAKAEVVVCDRAVLDNYCYLRRAAPGEPHVKVLEELVRAWLPTYDVLFRVPIVGDPSFDGVRDTDLAFQHDIDALLLATLEEWARPVRDVRSGGARRLGETGHRSPPPRPQASGAPLPRRGRRALIASLPPRAAPPTRAEGEAPEAPRGNPAGRVSPIRVSSARSRT